MPVRTRRLAFDGLPESPTPLHFYTLLVVRERRFVDAYVATLDLARAASSAGIRSADRANEMLDDPRVLCAIRERQDLASEMALLSAAEVRRDLRLMYEADASEVVAVHRVPCRHCHGANGQYQYTEAELYYLQQAHSYGESGVAFACVTGEFGPELHAHARAAWLSGKESRSIDLKGSLASSDWYDRAGEVNPGCPQCRGQGVPVVYVADTRTLSEGARKSLSGVRSTAHGPELVMVDKWRLTEFVAKDRRVGVERKEVVVRLPSSPDELDQALNSMTTRELEQFVNLDPGEYAEVTQELLSSRPERRRVGFRRGN